MNKFVFIVAIVVALLSAFFYFDPASTMVVHHGTKEPGWKVVIGGIFSISWIAFILMSVVCSFCIDRKKVAEAEYWFPAGYTFPPRRFLKESGQVFATIRFYAMIASGVLLLILLAVLP